MARSYTKRELGIVANAIGWALYSADRPIHLLGDVPAVDINADELALVNKAARRALKHLRKG